MAKFKNRVIRHKCRQCSKSFVSPHDQAQFCSDSHRNAWYAETEARRVEKIAASKPDGYRVEWVR